jgi:ELWxxDGT repeat protein
MKKKYILVAFLFSITFSFSQITEVSDINSTGDSNPTEFYSDSNNRLYFRANNGTDGNEPYIYDGTTVNLIKDINTTTFGTGSSNPGLFIEFNGLIYFKASDGDEDDGNNETELWQTDGTDAGTTLIADINPTASGNPQDFFVFNNELYFEVNDVTSTQIWSFNSGTPLKVTDNNGGSFASPSAPLLFSNGVYIRMNSGNGNNPHIFDGTTATELIDATTGTVRSRGVFNDEVYFEGDDGSGIGDELWKTDGTIAGTVLVADLLVGSGSSDPRDFVEFNGEFFFAAEDTDGYNLWKTDGTTEGTVLVANPNTSGDSKVAKLFSDGMHLYFIADNGTDGIELWKYDGAIASQIKNINTSGDSDPDNFITLSGTTFFSSDDGSGEKLWITDGTTTGTMTVASNIGSGADPVDVNNLTVLGTNLVFSGKVSNGDELFEFNPAALSIDDYNVINQLSIYPNPSKNKITVDGNFTSPVNYLISDINGRIVLKGALTNNTIKHNLNSGIYIIQLNIDNSSITKKLIVN